MTRRGRDVGYAGGAEDAAVTVDVGGRAEGFLEIVGEFDGGAAIGFVEFADEAERIERCRHRGLQSRKSLVSRVPQPALKRMRRRGSQRRIVEEIGCVAEIGRAERHCETRREISMQAENGIHVQGVGSDEKFLLRIAMVLFKPGDVLVAGDVGIFAVGALAGPASNPVRSIAKELRGAEGIGKKDEQFAAIGLLPKFEEAILRAVSVPLRSLASAARAMGSSCALVPMASRSCL